MSKTILVTGSSNGFGKLISETLLQNGYTVFATMQNIELKNAGAAEAMKTFASQAPGRVHVLGLDVTSENSVNEAIVEAISLEGNIDVVINNAGIGSTGWTEAFPLSQVQKMFDVNVFGIQRLMRAVLPSMRQRKEGLIINISSIQGRVVFPYSGIYTATKFAVEGLTESYHYELRKLGVDVVLLQPGGFKTNFESIQSGPQDKERLNSYGEHMNAPYKVWGEPGADKDFLPHPKPVPDAILELIEMPQASRPLRTLVDPLLGGEGPMAINNTATSEQEKLAFKLSWDI